MQDYLILFLFGLLLLILGLVFKQRDIRLYVESVIAEAEVVAYYEYHASQNNSVMQSMEVEYKLGDGTVMRTREQGGSNRPKYQIGARFDVRYSLKTPSTFIICGDHTRKYVFFGMIFVGITLMALFGYLLINEIII